MKASIASVSRSHPFCGTPPEASRHDTRRVRLSLVPFLVAFAIVFSAAQGQDSAERSSSDTSGPSGMPAASPATSAADADESLFFEDIATVSAAAKYDQTISQAPATVTVVTADEIARLGYRTLAEVLRAVPGFYTSYDRNYEYVGIRGFNRPGDYNTRILYLLDGVRLNNPAYNSAQVGTDFPVDLDLIHRIEVIRGPSASLYGTSAFFGVVNIITKSGRDFRGAGISGEMVTFSTAKGRTTYGNRFAGGAELLISGTVYDSAGADLYFPEFSEINGGWSEGQDFDRSRNFFAKLQLGDFQFYGLNSSRKKGVPTGAWETVFNSPGTFTVDGQSQFGALYSHTFKNRLNLTANLVYDIAEYKGEYIYDYAEEGDSADPVTNFDRALSNRWNTEVRAMLPVTSSHILLGGVEYRDNTRILQQNWDLETYLDDERDGQILGLFVQDEFKVHTKFIINAGLRYDRYDIGQVWSRTSPRVALIFLPTQVSTVKLLYGEAFRAPSYYELYYHDGGYTQKPALQLDPESIRTTELAWESGLGPHFNFRTSVFHYRIKDLISLVTDPADNMLVLQNLDSSSGTGGEFELSGRSPSGLSGRLGYSYQQAETSTGEWLSNSPRQMVKLSMLMPLHHRRFSVGWEGRYIGSRNGVSGEAIPGYFVANITAFWTRFLPGMELSASLYNMFNRKHWHPGSEEHSMNAIMQDGRTFRIKLAYLIGAK